MALYEELCADERVDADLLNAAEEAVAARHGALRMGTPERERSRYCDALPRCTWSVTATLGD